MHCITESMTRANLEYEGNQVQNPTSECNYSEELFFK